jgi:hypothetical protein
MKLSKETNEILSNFAEINQSLLFKEGNVLRTVSPAKSILAQAKIAESIPVEAPIYDVKQFLQTVNMFEDADINFGKTSVDVKNGKAAASYTYASKESIVAPPEKEIKLPSTEISFTLEKAAFAAAQRAAAVLGLPEIVLVGRKGKAYLTASDSKNTSSHKFEYPVGTAEENYNMIFKVENLKLLPRDYNVRVSAKGISHFESTSGDVQYWIAVESGSKYGE